MDLNFGLRYSFGFTKHEYNNRVFVANIYYGKSVKVSKECFDIIDDCITKKENVSEYFSVYSDDDREYMYKLIQLLLYNRIIVSLEDKEFDKEEKKKEVTLKLTNRCNLRCIHCCIDCRPDSEREELSTTEWKQVIDKLDKENVSHIIITGGEPMFRNDFFEIAEYAKDKIGVGMTLMTNGTLISEKNADRLLELFDSFSFSIDGADEESCSRVRGKGVFDKIIRGINLLKDRGMNDFSASFTAMKINYEKQEEFLELTKKLGATPMIRRFESYGRGADNNDILALDDSERFSADRMVPKELQEMDTIPMHLMPPCIGCEAVEMKFSIFENGDIYPCLVLDMQEVCLGNIKDIKTIKDYYESGDIYKTEGYKYFKELHMCSSSECKDCPAKLHCNTCLRDVYLLRQREDKKEICANYANVIKKVWE